MASVTVRVPQELKEEMAKLGPLNWSRVLRDAIAEEIRRAKMKRASDRIDQLRAKATIPWDSTRVIREWREKRR